MILVSVIIPTKNRVNSLERAIRSVANQTLKEIELIIVDDGSSDGTENFIKSIRDNYKIPIKYIKNEISKGGASARNQGANEAIGSFLAFLDSDDQWCPEHLEVSLNVLFTKELDGVFGNYKIVTGSTIKDRSLEEKPDGVNYTEYILTGIGDTRTSTFIFKTKNFRDVQFDDMQLKHQDWDLAIRFSEKYNLGFNKTASVLICENEKNRMSFRMNHCATKYFLEKHEVNLSEIGKAKTYYFLAKDTLLCEGKNKYTELYRNKSLSFFWKSLGKNYLKELKYFFYLLLLYFPESIVKKFHFIKNI